MKKRLLVLAFIFFAPLAYAEQGVSLYLDSPQDVIEFSAADALAAERTPKERQQDFADSPQVRQNELLLTLRFDNVSDRSVRIDLAGRRDMIRVFFRNPQGQIASYNPYAWTQDEAKQTPAMTDQPIVQSKEQEIRLLTVPIRTQRTLEGEWGFPVKADPDAFWSNGRYVVWVEYENADTLKYGYWKGKAVSNAIVIALERIDWG